MHVYRSQAHTGARVAKLAALDIDVAFGASEGDGVGSEGLGAVRAGEGGVGIGSCVRRRCVGG